MSLLSTMNSLPGLGRWVKDQESNYIEVNDEFSAFFGYKNTKELIGKNDYDLPIKTEGTATDFRYADRKVIESGVTQRFLEVYQVKNRGWQVILASKSALPIDSELQGTSGYFIRLPVSLFQIMAPMINFHSSPSSSYQLTSFDNTLTSRENECLFYTLQFKTSKEIAKILRISYRTVEQHIDCIKYKFNCSSKRELIAYCSQHGFDKILPETIFKNSLCFSL